MCENCSPAVAGKYAELDAFIDGLELDLTDERRRGRLIQILHRAQHIFGYLPREVQQHVAARMAIPESAVSGVVSFYNYFTTKPKGKYVLKVCRGTSCHVRRSDTVLQAIYNVTGMGEYKTSTDDGLFSIEIVSCLGACSLSPVVMVNDEVHPAMTPDKAMRLIAEIRTKEGVK